MTSDNLWQQIVDSTTNPKSSISFLFGISEIFSILYFSNCENDIFTRSLDKICNVQNTKYGEFFFFFIFNKMN